MTDAQFYAIIKVILMRKPQILIQCAVFSREKELKMDYKKAGVDIEAGYKSVELMKEHVKRTMREEVLGGLGGFSGAFSLKKIKDMDDPVLLSGTDGCGK